jgi:hypothetical protein
MFRTGRPDHSVRPLVHLVMVCSCVLIKYDRSRDMIKRYTRGGGKVVFSFRQSAQSVSVFGFVSNLRRCMHDVLIH